MSAFVIWIAPSILALACALGLYITTRNTPDEPRPRAVHVNGNP